MAVNKNLPVFAALSFTVAAAFGLVGCATQSDQSGNRPPSVVTADQASQLTHLVRDLGPGMAVVETKVPNQLQAAIENAVANTGGNNRDIVFLGFDANGQFIEFSVRGSTGDFTINNNPVVTERKLINYILQQDGAEVVKLEELPENLFQTTRLVLWGRNKNSNPQMAWVMEYRPFDGNILSIRPSNDEENQKAGILSSYYRMPRATDNTWINGDFDPGKWVSNQRRLHRANVDAGTPYPTRSSFDPARRQLQQGQLQQGGR